MDKANKSTTPSKLDPSQTREMDPKMIRKLVKDQVKRRKRKDRRLERINPASEEWSPTGPYK